MQSYSSMPYMPYTPPCIIMQNQYMLPQTTPDMMMSVQYQMPQTPNNMAGLDIYTYPKLV